MVRYAMMTTPALQCSSVGMPAQMMLKLESQDVLKDGINQTITYLDGAPH